MDSSHEPPKGARPIHRSQSEREFDGEKLQIHILDMLHVQDDWNFVLRDEASGLTAVIDPSEAQGVIDFLEQKGWGLNYILNTHHHWDHTDGNTELKQRYGAQVVGAARDAERIPGIDVRLEEGEPFSFGDCRFETFDVSGHTVGHIAYYLPAIPPPVYGGRSGGGNTEPVASPSLTLPRERGRESVPVLFPGDTLFAMGCGRMFEGTAAMFYDSLQRIAALPQDTVIYPAHEYTIPNGRFARSVEPGNAAINEHIEQARARRRRGEPSIPTTLARELASNPFLRTGSAEIRAALGMENAAPHEVFAELRRRKDRF